ncbi:NAC domain-containing protein [Trifolium pratense]|uniref:NAC domain-containing protein n=1 Tax=Trifolium pratense TaxID=57577 RepID=A0A2K3JZP1_TRIPR|nr:NAC domain-containing protein [Trifolium pratense]
MPIGYRFHPTEEELVGHYLEHKLAGNDSIVSNITEVNLNSIEPWELPGFKLVPPVKFHYYRHLSKCGFRLPRIQI